MQEKELSVVISAFGYLLSIIGGVIAIAGASFAYIFSRHREDNSNEHQSMIKQIDEQFDLMLEHEHRLTVIETSHNERTLRCERP